MHADIADVDVTSGRQLADNLPVAGGTLLEHTQRRAVQVEASVIAAVGNLPPLAPGLCRLLRVEPSLVVEPPAWMQEGLISQGVIAARDRWFVADATLLPFYAEDAAQAAPRLVYVDARPEDIEAWRVSNVSEIIAGRTPASFSLDPENEFFVPRAVAGQRVFGGMLQGL